MARRDSVPTEANTPFVGGANPQEHHRSGIDYNFFRVPADLNEAKKHGIANRVYVAESELKRTLNKAKICRCCSHKRGVEIPLCARLDSIYHLGSGHVLYFRFVKYAVAMLALMLVIGGCYNLGTNVAQGDCSSSKEANEESVYCVRGYILSFTLQNKRDNSGMLNTQLILNLTTVVLIMLFFHYLRYQFRKMKHAADCETVKPSDYTIEVQGVPIKATNEEIVEWVNGIAGMDQKVEIERIIRPYSINDYVNLVFNRSNLEVEKQGILKLERKRTSQEEKKVEEIDEKLVKITEKIHDLKENDLTKCPFIYITFRTSDQSKIMTRFEKNLLERFQGMFVQGRDYATHMYGDIEVRVRRAAEPTDIMWTNLKFDRQKKILTRFFILMVTLFMIILSLGIIILVNWWQAKVKEDDGENSRFVQVLSLGSSLVISLTNAILGAIITYFAKLERHWSYSHYLRSVAHKLTIAQFLNTALSTLFAQLILTLDDSISNTLQQLNFYGKGGLLENIYWVFIINAIFMAVLTITDPVYVVKWIKRYFVKKQGKNNTLTQMEANLLFEGPVLDMPDKYAGIIKVVLLATFYSPAIPFTFLFSIIGLTLIYWVDKYMLLRRMAFPKFLNNETTESMIEYLEWAAATFSVGNLVYVYTLKNSDGDLAFEHTALAWITLLISFLHVNLPMETVNKRLFPVKKDPSPPLDFQVARDKFRTDYDNELFLSSIVSLKEPIKQLFRTKDSPYKSFLQKIYGRLMFGTHQISKFVSALPSDPIWQQEHIEDQDLDYLDTFLGNMKYSLQKHEATVPNYPTPVLGKLANACKDQVKPENQNTPSKKTLPQSPNFMKCLSIKSPSRKSSQKEQKQPDQQTLDTVQIEIRIEKEEMKKRKTNSEQSVLLAIGTHRVSELESEAEPEPIKKEQKEILESTVSLIMNHSDLAEQMDSEPRMAAVNREVGK